MKIPLKLAVLGDPVTHSLSPRFQGAALTALKIDGSYQAIRTPAGTLSRRLDQLAQDGYLGLNLTVPLKVEGFRLLDDPDGGEDRLTPLARQIGAVNTLHFSRGEWWGENTDPEGFARAAEELMGELRGARVVVLGAGGAARAVVTSLCRRDVAEIGIWNRSRDRLERLLTDFPEETGAGLIRGITAGEEIGSHGVDLLVQATALGLHPADPLPPLPAGDATPAALDLITHPTPWQSACGARGCRVSDGRSMLLWQGAASFEIWTGLQAPVAAMRQALADD